MFFPVHESDNQLSSEEEKYRVKREEGLNCRVLSAEIVRALR